MTKDKAQKQAIRARMTKTGERYTTARLYLLDLHRTVQTESDDGIPETVSPYLPETDAEPSPMTPQPVLSAAESALPPRVTEPGMSDAAIQRGTGKSWDEWFAQLDTWGASTRSHPEIARYLDEVYGIGGWWAQGVTVGYERARGMRALYERPDGFSANASKTFPVSVERLFTAFVDAGERQRWLDGVELRLRTSQPHKSARFDVLPGEMRLAVTFVPKGPEKAAAQLQQERLGSAEDVAHWKALWKEQLALLAAYLPQESSRT